MAEFDRATARTTSILWFRHVDGTEQGGVVGNTGPDTFTVVSHPRYGTTEPQRFAYTDVAEVLRLERRNPVHLPTFDRLMRGAS